MLLFLFYFLILFVEKYDEKEVLQKVQNWIKTDPGRILQIPF